LGGRRIMKKAVIKKTMGKEEKLKAGEEIYLVEKGVVYQIQ
jgi:hypothetical protein